MNVIVFEPEYFRNFLPLSRFRSLMELRCGALTMVERIQRLGTISGLSVRRELNAVVAERTGLSTDVSKSGAVLLLNGSAVWDDLPTQNCHGASWTGYDHQGKLACLYISAKDRAAFERNPGELPERRVHVS